MREDIEDEEMSNQELNESLVTRGLDLDRLEEILDDFMSRFSRSHHIHEERMKNNYLKAEENEKKLNTMILELNGAVGRCRALFTEQKDKTPVWYEICKVSPPQYGEIWVKDINGTETLATCKGRAIIYPASSSLKAPEFWKPV